MNLQFPKPLVLLTYGLPGAGKSALARQLSEQIKIVHVDSNRIRYELFDDPQYTPSENNLVLRLADYMSEELLKVQQSVIFDMLLPTQKLRRGISELANSHQANFCIIWVQTDFETASYRATHRDRRKIDDRYSFNVSNAYMEKFINLKSPIGREPFIVVSGKHAFKYQFAVIMKRLLATGYIIRQSTHPPRVDASRRQPTRNWNAS